MRTYGPNFRQRATEVAAFLNDSRNMFATLTDAWRFRYGFGDSTQVAGLTGFARFSPQHWGVGWRLRLTEF
ncbi:MAG: hypothetical protein ACE5PV_06135 [Candidatus Poribacteria bacterium]